MGISDRTTDPQQLTIAPRACSSAASAHLKSIARVRSPLGLGILELQITSGSSGEDWQVYVLVPKQR